MQDIYQMVIVYNAYYIADKVSNVKGFYTLVGGAKGWFSL